MATFRNLTISASDKMSSEEEIDAILSFEDRRMFDTVNFVFICGLIGLFGIITNSMNMVVFWRQGFKNTMTISFMALAISDMGCLITLELSCFCMNPLLSPENLDFVPLEMPTLLGGWFTATFSRITGWITTYITAERCLCIKAPLAVRRIITPQRTVIILIIIYAINLLNIVPVYIGSYLGWKFYPEYNRSLVGFIATSQLEMAEKAAYLMQSVLVMSYFLCVTVLTIVLVVKLRKASKWRSQATPSNVKTEAMSTKDKKATNMVVLISSLLIVLYFSIIVLSLVSFIQPKFGTQGVYKNLYFSVWSFGLVFTSINSSVNIFMYYSMSTKYREIFIQIFLPTGKETINTGSQLSHGRSDAVEKNDVSYSEDNAVLAH